MDFNPFAKPIQELSASEITSALSSTSEGWFIEYKRQLLSPEKTARSVAAFANTRGGWLFFGVDAPSKSPGFPQSFPGISSSEAAAAQTMIRDAIKAHLSPIPFFEIHVIEGDDNRVPRDRAFIAVNIPLGPRPPYIHSSGVVFQRVADSCEPLPVRNRMELDELYERSEASTKRLQEFLDRRPADFNEQPHAQVFLLPDPYDVRHFRHSIKFERFAELMNPGADEFSLPFAHCQAINGAFIARQAGGMTWRFDGRGRHIINTVLPSVVVRHATDLRQFLHGYDHAESFAEHWKSAEYKTSRVVDLTMWGVLLLTAMKHVQALRVESNFRDDTGEMRCLIRLGNLGLATPFIDTPQFAAHVARFGLPMSHDGDVWVPGPGVDSMLDLSHPVAGRKEDSYMADAGLMMLMVAGAMGLPWSEVLYHPRPTDEAEFAKVSSPAAHAVSEWTAALQRALIVQSNRNASRTRSR